MSSFLDGPIAVAYHIVFWLAAVLTPLAGGLATAAAIIVFTIAVRLLLAPLSFAGLRGQARIAAIQPRVQELRARYARQPDKLQAELSSLYAQEAGGMLAGCLPLLLQLPFFSVMYRLFLSGTVGGKPNGLLSRTLFGTPLGSHWLTGAGPMSGQGLVFLGLFALLALVATLAVRAARTAAPVAPAQVSQLAAARQAVPSRAARRTRNAGGHTAGGHTAGGQAAGGRAAGGHTAGGQAAGGQPAGLIGAVTRILPYTTLIIAAFVPLAAGLYLLTTTTWTVAERTLLRRTVAPPAISAGALPLAGSAR